MTDKDDEDALYLMTVNKAGTAAMVNKVGAEGGRMTNDETAAMAAKLRAGGHPVVALRHVFDADLAAPRRPRTDHHSYKDKLLALDITEDTNIALYHKPWCDAACSRWNCNCEPEIVTSRPLPQEAVCPCGCGASANEYPPCRWSCTECGDAKASLADTLCATCRAQRREDAER